MDFFFFVELPAGRAKPRILIINMMPFVNNQQYKKKSIHAVCNAYA